MKIFYKNTIRYESGRLFDSCRLHQASLQTLGANCWEPLTLEDDNESLYWGEIG